MAEKKDRPTDAESVAIVAGLQGAALLIAYHLAIRENPEASIDDIIERIDALYPRLNRG